MRANTVRDHKRPEWWNEIFKAIARLEKHHVPATPRSIRNITGHTECVMETKLNAMAFHRVLKRDGNVYAVEAAT